MRRYQRDQLVQVWICKIGNESIEKIYSLRTHIVTKEHKHLMGFVEALSLNKLT